MDLAAALIALFAVKESSKPADSDHPFGHGKVENISAAVEALLIFVAAAWIIYEAVYKLFEPRDLGHVGWGALVMLLSLLVNVFISHILFKGGKETDSVALHADAWHLRTDVYTSAGVLIAMGIIWLEEQLGTGFDLSWIDPVGAILVALLIFKAAFQLTVQAGKDLLDVSLPENEEALIRESIEMFAPAVRGYHDLRTRKSGSRRFIEFHLAMDPELTVRNSHKMTEEISNLIKKSFPDSSATIHLEPCNGNCTPKCSRCCLLHKHYGKKTKRVKLFMDQRVLTVLGTASQVPTSSRNHIGFYLHWDREGILIDPGEGTQRQILQAGISATKIGKILISHFHGDHCLGLPGIVQRLSLSGVKEAVDIFYPASGEKYLNNLLEAAVFYRNLKLNLHPLTTPGLIYESSEFDIVAHPVEHRTETWGYRIKEPDYRTVLPHRLPEGLQGKEVGELKDKGSIEYLGRRITLQEVSESKFGQCFAYVPDTRFCENAPKLAENADLLVCESTYLSSEATQAEKYYHLTAKQAAQIAKQAGARKLVLAHYSQRYKNIKPFYAEAGAIHPDVTTAQDLQQIYLPKRKREL